MVDKTYVSWDKWNCYMSTITREMEIGRAHV